MLNNQVRPKLAKEFYPEPSIELEIRGGRFGSMGAYISAKRRNNSWTKGVFVFDTSHPRSL